MTAREGLRLVGALLLGAALALPAGMMLARRDAPERAPVRASQAAAARKVFSPSVRDDPYFLVKQREGVEALEAYCRRSGEMCAEAKQARARLAELTGE